MDEVKAELKIPQAVLAAYKRVSPPEISAMPLLNASSLDPSSSSTPVGSGLHSPMPRLPTSPISTTS